MEEQDNIMQSGDTSADTTTEAATDTGASMVDVYSTPSCMYCNLLKDFLKENNVAYTEYNVAEDEEKRNFIVEKSGQLGVPVSIIGDEVIVGFNQAKISELLKL